MSVTLPKTGRRNFLKVTGAGSLTGLAATTTSTLAKEPATSIGSRRQALKSGSDSTLTPPFAVRVLSKMGFGLNRGITGSSGGNPDVILASGFESLTTNFAATGDLAYFQSLGSTDDERLTAYVDEQLSPTDEDPELDARMAEHAASFTQLDQSQTALYSQYECAGFSEYRRPLDEVEKFTLNAACYSRWQLRELMVDFWHNHLNVFARINPDVSVSWVSWDRDVMRANVFGNFYDLIYTSSQHVAMLRYLDNYVNGRDGAINENYCRELFELHCLGSESYVGNENPRFVETLNENPYTVLNDAELNDPSLGFLADPSLPIAAVYTDDDVLTAAQSMTGWRYGDENTDDSCGSGLFFAQEDEHNKDSTKAVLMLGVAAIPSGLDAETEGRLIVKLAAYHPATARHIAKKLCQRLISDTPPESVIDAAAATFFAHRKSPDQIARTLRTILLSSEFKSPTQWGAKVRRPFEYVVSAMRAAGCDYTWRLDDSTSSNFNRAFDAVGQKLFDWRTPDGYPDDRAHWEGSTTLVQGWRTIDFLLDRNVSDEENRVMRAIDITLNSLSGNPTPRQLVEFWCNWTLGFSPAGGWSGQGSYANAPTDIGRAALQFMTQDYPGDLADAETWGADTPIPRSDLVRDAGSERWRSRLTGLVKLVLWSPQFLQR